ncbi:DUF6428 family protein [Limnoglobus roseus]|uniref:Uncharacterized protein n=1 Tax=Limnoglobus roseus TaxID=2598579 RepID=A0A5C1A8B8_9BACT|nr:DUF6428 family protein [Limnoglobus roseus]QEL14433.1 hypothetical protein PX52LOC_01321 [Limnoglobus roseus]
MTVTELSEVLAAHPGVNLHFMLPDGAFVPSHFHVTEVGRVRKDFIDCGGTVRSTESCVLQLWVADDKAHRLDAAKLANIVRLAAPVLGPNDPPVEVEYDAEVITQLPVTGVEVTPAGLLFLLGGKHTACLAPDKCGVGAAGCC